MKISHTPTTIGRGQPLPGAANTRLSGRWLLLAKAVWMVLAGGAFVIFVLSVPWRFIQLAHPAAGVRANLAYLGLSIDFYAGYNLVLEVVFIGCFLAVAMIIFWRRSDDWMALFVSLFLVTFGISLPPTIYALAMVSPTWQIAMTCMNVLGWGSLNVFVLLFPTGRFVPRWMRWLLPWFLLYVLLWHLPNVLPFHPTHWPSPLLAFVEISIACLIMGVGIYRYRHTSTWEQRKQIKWVVFGTIVALFISIIGAILLHWFFPVFTQRGSLYDMFMDPFLSCSLLLIPVSLGIAILRSHLWDIDIIINRTLVYGALTASIVGIYILVVVLLGQLLQANGNLFISLLATGFIAVLFQPLRERLQRLVNRLMYGERDTPYKVISRLGQRLEATLAPDTVLATITETVAQALKLPYAAITLKQDEEFTVAASYGSLREELFRLPLIYQTELVGELVLAFRAPGETFSPADHALLADLARQAGVAAHAVRLTTDLQRLTGELQQSRTQLVTAREEERRRLRRDLHDGLGSVLASLNWRAGAIRSLLSRDPVAADTLVVEQQHTIQAAIADIRRLVYDLRPPA